MRVLDLVQDKDEFLDRIFVDQIQIFQIFVSVRFRQIQISQIQQYYRNTCNIIAINLQFCIGVSRIFKFIFTYFGIEQPLLQLKNLVCSSHVIRTILIKCCYSYNSQYILTIIQIIISAVIMIDLNILFNGCIIWEIYFKVSIFKIEIVYLKSASENEMLLGKLCISLVLVNFVSAFGGLLLLNSLSIMQFSLFFTLFFKQNHKYVAMYCMKLHFIFTYWNQYYNEIMIFQISILCSCLQKNENKTEIHSCNFIVIEKQ
eukprot:TRINITY_DN7891_c0_g3_i12.p1 TRINITY_DN7891_c0_g3~~TRINITY_DN7891_c0_g3_i12.p1  ORF type:complete len:259 (+),score=-13.37 TRINITY_DN7891_c0_g3_i12:484-1260(+)